jgi:hypothetical protein
MDLDREKRRKPGAGPDPAGPAAPAPGKQTLAPAVSPAAVRSEADYAALTAKSAEPDAVILKTSEPNESSTATTQAIDHQVMVARVTVALQLQQDELSAALADPLTHRLLGKDKLGQRERDQLQAELERTEDELARVKAGVDPAALRDIVERHRLVVGHAMRKTDGATAGDERTWTLQGGTLKRAITSKQVIHAADADVATKKASTLTLTAQGTITSTDRRETSELRTDGSRSSNALATEMAYDLAGGRVTGSVNREEVKTGADGASVKRTEQTSVSAAAKGGALRFGVATGESNAVTPAGGSRPTAGSSAKYTRGASLLGGKKGVGAALDATNDTSVTNQDGTVDAGKRERSIALSTKGVSGKVGKTATRTTKGGGEIERKVSADGGLTAEVEKQDDGTYLVTITLHAGVTGALKGSTKQLKDGASGAQVGGNLGASMEAELRWTKVLDEDKAAALLSEVEQADGTKTKYVGLLARIKAFGMHGGDAATSVVALFDSAAGVEELAVGETITVQVKGEVSAGAKLSAKGGAIGGSIGGSATAGASRSLSITRVDPAECNGKRCVDLTVGFGASASGEAEGSVELGHAGMGHGRSTAQSLDDKVTVRLDADAPEYAALYARVLHGMPDDVRALARAQTERKEASSGKTDKISVGPVGLEVGDTSRRATEQKVEDGRVTVTEEGGRTQGGALSLGETKVAQGSTTNTARLTADRGGSTLSLDTTRERSDLGKAFDAIGAGIADRFKAVFAGTGADGKKLGKDQQLEQAVDAVTQSPGERLKAELEKTYASLERYHLGPAQIRIIVERAADAEKWAHLVGSPRILATWEALREVLLYPRPALEVDGVGLEQAREITRGQAIAMFVEEFGSTGLQALIGVLRRWGSNLASAPRAAAAGVHEQWPERIARLRPLYEEAQADVEFADEEFAKRATRTDKTRALPGFYDGVRSKLAVVRAAIATCDQFTDPSARLEMLDHVDQLGNQLEVAWRRNAHLADDRPKRGLDLVAAFERSDPEAEGDHRRAWQLAALLDEYGRSEADLFERVKELLPVNYGGTNEGWFAAGNGKAARELLESPRTSQLYTNWIAKVRELRAVYERIGTPPDQWQVAARGAPRSRNQPDVEQRIKLYLAANKLSPNMNMSGLVQTWRDQAAD